MKISTFCASAFTLAFTLLLAVAVRGAEAPAQNPAPLEVPPQGYSLLDNRPFTPGVAANVPVSGNTSQEALFPIELRFAQIYGSTNDNYVFGATFKPGTTLLAVFKHFGLEKLLTDASRISINAVVEGNAQPLGEGDALVLAPSYLMTGPHPSRLNSPPKTTITKIKGGELVSGKIKDPVLTPIPLPDGARWDVPSTMTLTFTPFVFEGGSVNDFVAAMQKHFGVDWGILELPPEAASVHVPKLRVGTTMDDTGICTFNQVVELYNHLSGDPSSLGKWTWSGDLFKPQALTLALPRTDYSPPPMKVKAVSLAKFDSKDFPKFMDGLIGAIDQSETLAGQLGGNLTMTGRVSVQADTKVLLVAGTPAYIDFVESYIEAASKAQPAAPKP